MHSTFSAPIEEIVFITIKKNKEIVKNAYSLSSRKKLDEKIETTRMGLYNSNKIRPPVPLKLINQHVMFIYFFNLN